MSRSSTEPTDQEWSAARYERLLEIQSLMARVSREIGPSLDLEHVLDTVLKAIRSLLSHDGATVSLLEGEELVIVSTDLPVSWPAPAPQGTARGIAGHVVRTGVSARSDDLGADERLPAPMRHAARQQGVASYLCVPLNSLGDTIGVIQAFATRPSAFHEDDRVLLEGLATQVAGAIESARRYRTIAELEVLKSDFIARVSHELRTPITIMSGFISTMLTNHDRLDNDTRRRMLERVDVASARLGGLIDQLLMLSRLEAGVMAARSETVVASDVLEEVRRESDRPDDVEIVCADDVRFTTDHSLLVRALGFLVDNALKYAGACRLDAEDGRIEVLDAGPGIAPEHRSHVFERFTRANDDTTIAGMGIGLPMARTLLAAAGADLKVEDPVEGPGTRLVIRFW